MSSYTMGGAPSEPAASADEKKECRDQTETGFYSKICRAGEKVGGQVAGCLAVPVVGGAISGVNGCCFWALFGPYHAVGIFAANLFYFFYSCKKIGRAATVDDGIKNLKCIGLKFKEVVTEAGKVAAELVKTLGKMARDRFSRCHRRLKSRIFEFLF